MGLYKKPKQISNENLCPTNKTMKVSYTNSTTKQTNKHFFHKLVWENAILVKLMGNITTIVRQYISGLFFVYKVNNNVLFCISLIFSKQILCFFSIFFCFDHKISKLLNNYLKSTLWVRV